MKLISIILSTAIVFISSVSLSAQNYMEVKGSKLLVDGKELPSFAVTDYIGFENNENTYVPAVKQYKAGLGLLIPGCIICAAGLAMTTYGGLWWDYAESGYDVNEGEMATNLLISGMAMTFVGGFGMVGAGSALYCIGKSRIKWCADDYNRKNYGKQVSLNLSSGRNGVGLALNF